MTESADAGEWYYAIDGRQFGPLSLDAMRMLVANGRLREDMLVWCAGMPNWLAAGTEARLFAPKAPAQPWPYDMSAEALQNQSAVGQPLSYERMVPPSVQYGGFWLRFCAAFIDGILVGVVNFVVGLVIGFVIGAILGSQGASQQDIEGIAGIAGFIFGVLISWLYEAIMTSSKTQATLGKMAIGLIVTDEQGQRIGFGRSTGRFFGKYLSQLILLIGYIMAAFTEKKQGLHDIMAGTLVVKK